MNDKVKAFGDLHVPGNPLILYNIWDAGSAKAVAEAGAKAIATGSWGVACSLGYKDGETLPLDAALENLDRILSVTDLPVTIDMEAGYGADPGAVGASVARAATAGAVGINIEDKDPATRKLFETGEAAARFRAAADSGLWINARADLFIVTPREQHDAALADTVVERAKAYADAGANSLFVPFVYDPALIARICENSPLPVNILVGEDVPDIATLAGLGVARISHGHGPWAKAMEDLAASAKAAMAALG
ncbi:MAG TPA: isocitrate lyase/phosphoenolpyruvate mutase family protein [Sphingorhabdus sp.]|nr:isocitrate lyase/phosphoenolpyruvate mutase family protein [Sphingorhabdus sp.]